MTRNALEMFRSGFDYIEIASKMRIEASEVERQIHRLRNMEKGDTTQEDYLSERLRRQVSEIERKRAYNREYQRRIRQEIREARAAT